LTQIKFRPVSTARLFYGQWMYCIKFYLREATALRNTLEAEEIETILEQRLKWRNEVQQRWPQNSFVHGRKDISQDTVVACQMFGQFLKAQSEPYKMLISVDHVWIYTNSVGLVQRIHDLHYVMPIKLTQAVIDRQSGVIELHRPQHTHRSYFRCRKLIGDQKEQLRNFLRSQTDIRTSKGLEEWLDTHWNRTQDYYFVDHNGESWLTLLSLVAPGLIRRTLPIIAK
jgi:hypothetical protein